MDDLISRQAAIEGIEDLDWYHQNKNKDMVLGANSDEHQAWYKADDIYKALESLPSAQPEIVMCKDCKHRDAENGFCEGRGWPMQLVPDDGFCDKGERSEE